MKKKFIDNNFEELSDFIYDQNKKVNELMKEEIQNLISQESLDKLIWVNSQFKDKTPHFHHHILFDLGRLIDPNEELNYLEIGCHAGTSAGLMLQRPKTNVLSIDCGTFIKKDVVCSNIGKVMYWGTFDYLESYSEFEESTRWVRSKNVEFDILFIDGDHSTKAVMRDFLLYKEFVKKGGFIVFDDYNDHKYSPGVKPAVDSIVKDIDLDFIVIGDLDNTFEAHPKEMTKNNCFILRKK